MNHVGRITTDGNPICIGAADLAAEWDGANFPELSASEQDSLVSTFVDSQGVRFAIVWARSDGLELFASRREFALVEIQGAPEDFEPEFAEFDLECLKVDPEILKLGHFGGRLALFDARLSGVDLDLFRLGCSRSRSPLDPVGQRPDTALIDIDPGVWSVSLFLYEEGEVVLWGLWFQRMGARP
jgi:hypothetical protein